MEKKLIFEMLGIEKTRDEEVIKSAYRMKLVETNPEDKPQEFMMLRKAYEEAMNYARNGVEDDVEEREMVNSNGIDKDSPVGLWMQKVEAVYRSIKKRMDEQEWIKLFDDSVCSELEYSVEAKRSLLQFCSEHFQMNNKIYCLINERFAVEETQDELKEYLPEGFVNYFVNRVHDADGNMEFPWEWLEGDEYANYDEFIHLERVLEQQMYEDDIRNAADTIMKLEELHITHPFFEIEKIRFNVLNGNKAGIEEKVEELTGKYPDSLRIPLLGAEAIWKCGNHRKAIDIFRQVKEKSENYLSDKYLALYANEQGNCEEAIEYAEKCLRVQYDEEVSNLLRELNEKMLDECTGQLPHTVEEAERYVKACLDTEQIQKGIDFLAKSELLCEMENGHGYLSELYLQANEWDFAIESANMWLEKLEKQDNQEEVRKRIAAAYSYIARAAFSMGKEAEAEKRDEKLNIAVENARKAILMENEEFWVNHRMLLLDILMEQEEYEKAEEEVNALLEVYPNVYIFLEKKQKIAYELGNAQDVIDIFYQAQEIYPRLNDKSEVLKETISLYERAAEVFWHYSQYSNARSVLKQADEIEVSSPRLTYMNAREARRLMRDTGKYSHAMSALDYTNKLLEIDENDINELMERCIIYLDIQRYAEALEDAKKVVEFDSEYSWGYHFLARSYYYMKEYEKAIEFEQKAIDLHNDEQGVVDFFLTAGWASERMGKYEQANEWYRKGIEKCHSSRHRTFYRRMIRVAKQLGDYDSAERIMDEAYEKGCYGEAWEYKKDKLYLDCVRYDHQEEYGLNYIKGLEEIAEELEYDAEVTNELADAYMVYSNDRELTKKTYYKAYKLTMESQDIDNFSAKKNVIHLMQLSKEDGDMQQVEEYGKIFRKLLCDIYEEEDEEQAQKDFITDIYGGRTNFYDLGVYWAYMGDLEKARQCAKDLGNCARCRTCNHEGCTDHFELLAIITELEGKYEEALKLYEKAKEFDKFNLYAAWKVRVLKEKVRG